MGVETRFSGILEITVQSILRLAFVSGLKLEVVINIVVSIVDWRRVDFGLTSAFRRVVRKLRDLKRLVRVKIGPSGNLEFE